MSIKLVPISKYAEYEDIPDEPEELEDESVPEEIKEEIKRKFYELGEEHWKKQHDFAQKIQDEYDDADLEDWASEAVDRAYWNGQQHIAKIMDNMIKEDAKKLEIRSKKVFTMK